MSAKSAVDNINFPKVYSKNVDLNVCFIRFTIVDYCFQASFNLYIECKRYMNQLCSFSPLSRITVRNIGVLV